MASKVKNPKTPYKENILAEEATHFSDAVTNVSGPNTATNSASTPPS
jgi:hypothetical protein